MACTTDLSFFDGDGDGDSNDDDDDDDDDEDVKGRLEDCEVIVLWPPLPLPLLLLVLKGICRSATGVAAGLFGACLRPLNAFTASTEKASCCFFGTWTVTFA